ncbi:unnamed protein product [Meganyctiphanes norvegica]|uniref:Uncharacterized protein n=1 Tax=Meganyctiphanes norvegica TaxID=48144 RepID=A0AAV2Q370_MEGNR
MPYKTQKRHGKYLKYEVYVYYVHKHTHTIADVHCAIVSQCVSYISGCAACIIHFRMCHMYHMCQDVPRVAYMSGCATCIIHVRMCHVYYTLQDVPRISYMSGCATCIIHVRMCDVYHT